MAKQEKSQDAGEQQAKQEEPTPEVQAAADARGMRARRAMMMKEFVPSADFINKHVVAGGKGTKVMLGRIFGFVTSVAEKKGTLPNGEPSVSIVLNGQFESENYLDGEVSMFSSVYFPSSFSEMIKAMFAADESLKVVEIDTDIGVEATGKTIPYTWVVVNHIEGEAVTPLKRLRAARGRPANVPQIAGTVAQKALEAPKG